MKFFGRIFRSGSDILKSIKNENKKQLVELEKLEQQIEELQKTEKEKQVMHGWNLTNRSSLRFWLIGLVIFIIAYFVFKSLNILFLILTAFIVSLAMEAIIDFLQKKLRHRGISILLSYLFLIILVLAGLFFIIPFLLSQMSEIMTIFTNNIANIQTLLKTTSVADIVSSSHWIPGAAKEIILDMLSDPTIVAGVQNKLQANVSQLISLGTTYAKDIGNLAINFVGSFLNFLTQTSIVLTLAVLFSLQKSSVMKFISGLRGNKKYKFVYMKLERIYKKLGVRLQSQLLLCVFIGLAVLLALWILSLCGMDIPQKGSLALIAGITEFIPYIGPLLGGFVAVLVAYIHLGWVGALIVLAIFILIQWLENNVLIPVLMNRTLGINPVVIFISMIIGGLLMGLIGILLAVPIAVIITIVFEKTFDE